MTTINEGVEVPTETFPSYDSLTYLQKQKYDYLNPIFNDELVTAKLVLFIDGRGRNAFSKITEKIDLLNLANHIDQHYHDALYDNFNIDSVYTSSEIVGIVSQVRRELGMKPYSSRWKQNCEADFFTLYIVHDVYNEMVVDGAMKKIHAGYKPVFKLKIED